MKLSMPIELSSRKWHVEYRNRNSEESGYSALHGKYSWRCVATKCKYGTSGRCKDMDYTQFPSTEPGVYANEGTIITCSMYRSGIYV